MTLTTRRRWQAGAVVLQAASLLAVAVAVVGILWVREFRSAGAGINYEQGTPAMHLRDFGSCVSRDELAALDIMQPSRHVQSLQDPDRMQALLPVGSRFDVVVKGGFVASRKDNLRGESTRTHVAYAFEMSYQRIIESNDGRRIVERRLFGSVRTAKVLSNADKMSLDLGSVEQLPLEQLGFPTLQEGITVASPASVAGAMLSRGERAVVKSESSLAPLEMGSLSDKSIRLTYMDGVGIESVEALGSDLLAAELTWLFCQSFLPVGVHMTDGDSASGQQKFAADELTSYSDPVKVPFSHFRLRLDPISASDGSVCGMRVLQKSVASDDPRQSAGGQSPRHPPARTSIGSLHYDSSGTFVQDAIIHWPYSKLSISPTRLLFEDSVNDFQTEPTFTVHYHCQRQ